MSVNAFLDVVTKYTSAKKGLFHSRGKRVLLELAQKLGYGPNDFDVRSNKGGPAVSGEVILHSDSLYVQFSQSCLGPVFMWRTCKSRKDYCGNTNQWMKWDALRNLDSVAATMMKMVVAEQNKEDVR